MIDGIQLIQGKFNKKIMASIFHRPVTGPINNNLRPYDAKLGPVCPHTETTEINIDG